MLFDANRLTTTSPTSIESEDAEELKEILGRGYHAVVGNPPYIAGEMTRIAEAYRARYATLSSAVCAHGPVHGALLRAGSVRDDGGNPAGFVGKITAQ